MDSDLIKYVRENLSTELIDISMSNRTGYETGLTIYEKAIIYHYTDYGYESLNQQLRSGESISKFGLFSKL